LVTFDGLNGSLNQVGVPNVALVFVPQVYAVEGV
jgi:hypothetical protein